MHDVIMPDGTIIKDVPDGTTQAQLRAKLERNGFDMNALLATPGSTGNPEQGQAVYEVYAKDGIHMLTITGPAGADRNTVCTVVRERGNECSTTNTLMRTYPNGERPLFQFRQQMMLEGALIVGAGALFIAFGVWMLMRWTKGWKWTVGLSLLGLGMGVVGTRSLVGALAFQRIGLILGFCIIFGAMGLVVGGITDLISRNKSKKDAPMAPRTDTKGASGSDEHYYLKATQEFDSPARDQALWAKSMALHDGNVDQAKYAYIRIRVATMKVDVPVH